MSKNLDKLKRLLAELFQLDQADLDFGIYRIMNQKRDDIVRFLDDDLLPQVKQAFSQYQSTDRAAIQTELDQAIESASDLEVDPDTVPKVKELRAKLEESGMDIAALESEVFSHLYSFFRRYYHEGDFLSLRRYKEGVYAIPYEGEEVKLHWANADQYYIKSSEYLRDYTFKLPSGKRELRHALATMADRSTLAISPLGMVGSIFIFESCLAHSFDYKQNEHGKFAMFLSERLDLSKHERGQLDRVYQARNHFVHELIYDERVDLVLVAARLAWVAAHYLACTVTGIFDTNMTHPDELRETLREILRTS